MAEVKYVEATRTYEGSDTPAVDNLNHTLENIAKMLGKPKVEVKKEGILNNIELRYNNEPARHKLLDMIGDLALVGVPLRGHIMAARPGHAANVAFAKKIKTLIKKI